MDEYENTIYIEEALHRLVEVHYIIGLTEEAKKYAKILGYNYQSSKWYEQTYSVFNKKYETREKKENKNSILGKVKSILD